MILELKYIEQTQMIKIHIIEVKKKERGYNTSYLPPITLDMQMMFQRNG
jgi:hypothetical protein